MNLASSYILQNLSGKYSAVVIIFLYFSAVSCTEDTRILSESGLSASGQPVLRLAGLEPCEPNTTRKISGARLMDVFSPEFGSLDRLKVTVQPGKASFIHQGATMKACLDSVGLSLKCRGGLYLVVETEYISRECSQVCDYIIHGEIAGLPSGACTIEVRNTSSPERILCSTRVTIPR